MIASSIFYNSGKFLFQSHTVRAMECSNRTGDLMPPDDKQPAHLRVRIEPKLLERLEKARKWHRRTMTGEIVERLENSFRQDDITDAISSVESEVATVADAVDSLDRGMDRDMKLMREELHQIRTELQELRRAIAPPPSTLLYPPPPAGEQK